MRSSYVLPIFLLLGACGEVNKAKKNMDNMNEKTTRMAETTEEMNNRMVDTNDLMGWLGTLTKQGDGFKIRTEAMEELKKARTLNKKIEAGIAYMYAFEFQLYSPKQLLNVNVVRLRELLFAHAVAELGKTLPELLPEGSRWGLDATDDSNRNLTLMALSAVLHRINYLQTEQLQGTPMRPMSMLDLLVESLAKKERLNRGEIARADLTELDREVLREEQAFKHLLRLRFKTLPVIALGRISHIQDGFFRKLDMLFTSWTPQFSGANSFGAPLAPRREGSTSFTDLNIEQIEYAADVIDEALRTQRFLVMLSSAVKLDRKIERIYRNMETRSITARLDGERDRAVLTSIRRFESAVAELLRQ